MKNLGLTALFAALIIGGFAFFQKAPVVVLQDPVGANPGPFYTETQYLRGGVSVGGGIKIETVYATTTSWDSGSLTGGSGAQGFGTSTASFILRPAGENYALPGVGDTCFVGNENASSSKVEGYSGKVTAVDTTSGFKNASATLTYVNYGALIDYGVATLNWVCVKQ